MQSGNEIIETQTYYTEPENDWVFDETQKMTYDNPVYIEQKRRKHETIDDSGFVVPKKISDLDDDEEPEVNTFNDDDDDWDDDWDDDDVEVVDKPISFKKEPPKENKDDMFDFINKFENKEKEKKEDLSDFINSFDQPKQDAPISFKTEPRVESPIVESPVIENPIPSPIVEEPQPSQQQTHKKVLKFKL